jgi:hypothetical protein
MKPFEPVVLLWVAFPSGELPTVAYTAVRVLGSFRKSLNVQQNNAPKGAAEAPAEVF